MRDEAAIGVETLARAETEIALIDRSRPLGLQAEFRRICAAWSQGESCSPQLQYRRSRSLREVQRKLECVADRAVIFGDDGPWLAGRARELLLDASLAEAIGSPGFARIACERFPVPRGPLATELERSSQQWLQQGAQVGGSGSRSERTYRSDDRHAPESLWSVLSRRVGRLRLGVRIFVEDDLASVAACGRDTIVIRARTNLTASAAKRIAEHEISGHLLPRIAASRRMDVLRCGCAGANDQEEGRALLIEQRLGLMDVGRRAELGARHLACVYMRRGATFVDAVRGLTDMGAPLEVAIRAMLRATRGGGLGRELVYLPSMRMLDAAFDARPELEDWFCEGRASLDYAEARLSRELPSRTIRTQRVADDQSSSTQTGT